MKSQSQPVGMSTGEAALYLGRGVKTLQAWDREGKLKPEGRTLTGRRVYTREQLDVFMGLRREIPVPIRSIVYCRVSSKAQKPDLKNQRRVLEEFCAARGLVNVEWSEEIGSGLDFDRKKFTAIMEAVERGEIKTLVVAHKDRLTRFGFSWFDAMCKRHGCELLVLNNESLSPEQEMIQDLMTIIHCFSSRLYGLRNYRKNLKEALKQNQKKES
ncbi:putative resolvase [Gammaproteobacteria bacterium]